jgi:hypothetical protein
MLKGRVTPLFGAGANLSGRPQDARWQPGSPYVPSSDELAEYLARTFGYPDADGAKGNEHVDEAGAVKGQRRYNLARVCQYVTVDAGEGPLYDELRDVFTANSSPPTPLHQFFARLAELLRARWIPPRYQLILTTNYDDALERAFGVVGEPFDVVWYVADGRERGKFWHRPHDGEPRLIRDPNAYDDLWLADDRRTDRTGRTVILKLHGTVNRDESERDSFVITEDHYIDYLTRTDIASLLPAKLSERIASTHLLLLGHSMRDWNLRVILYRVWGDQRLTYRPWSIQREASYLERRFWERRGNMEIFDADLGEYVAALEEHLPAVAEEIFR